MQQATAAPDDILQMHQNLAANSGWGSGSRDSPSPLGELSFRLSRLRAAAKTGELDSAAIFDMAMCMDQDLATWAASIPDSWKYVVVAGEIEPTGTSFGSKLRHVYNSPWAAQTWNNYRTLRILVRQLIVRHCDEQSDLDSHIALIHELSAEICISTEGYNMSPRK
jgi:hypothetical protein